MGNRDSFKFGKKMMYGMEYSKRSNKNFKKLKEIEDHLSVYDSASDYIRKMKFGNEKRLKLDLKRLETELGKMKDNLQTQIKSVHRK